jgi:hypothetical protein
MLVLFAVLVALPAQADLYRWRDPQTGSIKFSNAPPPWYGDPVREIGSPPVEVVPDLSPRARTVAPAAETKGPVAKPAAPSPGMWSGLESQFATLLQFFQSMPSRTDFDRTGAAFQQQADMYRALSAELDRQDPAGAARRRAMAQESGILDQLKRGLEAFSSTKPPVQK